MYMHVSPLYIDIHVNAMSGASQVREAMLSDAMKELDQDSLARQKVDQV